MKEELKTLQDNVETLWESNFEKANFALETNGAEIVSIFDTKMTRDCNLVQSFLQTILNVVCGVSNSPRRLLQGKIIQGDCWRFDGNQGRVLIKLERRIVITSISVQHVTADEAPYGLTDAPRDIRVYVGRVS